ncbi:hypothetical protein HWV62_45252 [Athelia sp. TMB]|nr:hypothetical protein HWV62_45252 [Athelia sp. TMB]
MSAPILITADEINCLIYAYLQDSEGRLDQSPHYAKNIPRGELVELLSKALLYVEVEAHWKGDAMTTGCKSGFSLLETHVCSIDPKGKAPNPPIRTSVIREKEPESATKANGDSGSKRKADVPATDKGHAEKRAKRSPDDMDVDPPPASAAECV